MAHPGHLNGRCLSVLMLQREMRVKGDAHDVSLSPDFQIIDNDDDDF